MKVLIIGIDGLGRESLESFGLHRLKARLASGLVGSPSTEHRISRGWPEIFTGETAWVSGCFYQVPERAGDGRLRPTQRTGQSTAEEHLGAERMLWHRLAAQGHKTSIFTVPTVSMPFDTGGYFVGATGGGKFGSSISKEDIFPQTLLKHARIADLDLGMRSGYGAFMPRNIDDLETKAVKHLSDYFFTLGVAEERRPSDVAFVGTRFLNELSYKFIALVQSEPADTEARAQKELVLALAERFDEMLDRFIDQSGADELFIVSDHGIGRMQKEFNLNEAMVELGYVVPDPLRSTARQLLHGIRKVRAKRPVQPRANLSYKLATSIAFSIGYIDALYINDGRLAGPEMSSGARHEMAATISERLTDYMRDVIGEPGITFAPTGARDWAAGGGGLEIKKKIALPDILCHVPSGYANEKQTRGFIAKREIYFGHEIYARGFPGEYSGIKANDTLTCYIGAHGNLVIQDRLVDLYDSILAVAGTLA